MVKDEAIGTMPQPYHVCQSRRHRRKAPARSPWSVKEDWLAHQGVIGAEEIVDFFHGRLAGDQVIDIAPERLGQLATNKCFAPAGLVDDFIAAKAQGFKVLVGAKLDD